MLEKEDRGFCFIQQEFKVYPFLLWTKQDLPKILVIKRISIEVPTFLKRTLQFQIGTKVLEIFHLNIYLFFFKFLTNTHKDLHPKKYF